MKPICIIQNCHTETPGIIANHFDNNQIHFIHAHSYRGDELPEVKKIGAAIITGTPVSARDYARYDYLRSLYDFLHEAVKFHLPLLGICFGGQLLSMVMGGEVTRNPVREIGIFEIHLTNAGRNDTLFAGFDKSFKAFQWHADTFSIPPGAEMLAEGDLCRNQAFRKGNSLGIQFHFDLRLEEIPGWCDTYHKELEEEGLVKEKIVSDFTVHAALLSQYNSRLLDNFLAVF